jgi:hypothetical protein
MEQFGRLSNFTSKPHEAYYTDRVALKEAVKLPYDVGVLLVVLVCAHRSRLISSTTAQINALGRQSSKQP